MLFVVNHILNTRLKNKRHTFILALKLLWETYYYYITIFKNTILKNEVMCCIFWICKSELVVIDSWCVFNYEITAYVKPFIARYLNVILNVWAKQPWLSRQTNISMKYMSVFYPSNLILW